MRHLIQNKQKNSTAKLKNRILNVSKSIKVSLQNK